MTKERDSERHEFEPPVADSFAQVAPERIFVRWMEDRGGHMNWCVVSGHDGGVEYVRSGLASALESLPVSAGEEDAE